MIKTYFKKDEWFGNIRGDILSGLVVALALIPEAIAFSIIAGVDPKIGLYASFCIAVVISFFGGRPGFINGYISKRLWITIFISSYSFNGSISNNSWLFTTWKIHEFCSKSCCNWFCKCISFINIYVLITLTYK